MVLRFDAMYMEIDVNHPKNAEWTSYTADR